MSDIDDILKKYDTKLKENIKGDSFVLSDKAFSREYSIFRNELLNTNQKLYEKLAKITGKIIAIKPKDEEYKTLDDSIKITHLNITPEDAASFGIVIGIGLVFLGLLLFVFNLIFTGELIFLLPSIIVLAGAFSIKPLSFIPN